MAKKKNIPWLSESDEDADWLKKIDGGRYQRKDLAASATRKDELKAALDALRQWVRDNGRTS